MHILGVSCHYHDAGAVLLRDGFIVAAAEEERFTRIKHDSDFPQRSIDFCLQRAGISGSALDFVVFYEKPLVKFERILTTALGNFPRSSQVFSHAMALWFEKKLWIKSRILRNLGVPAERVLFMDHHLSHAASAFLCSPFREAAILTVDGVGEWSTATMGRGTADWDGTGRTEIRLTHEMRFPHSLGLLYSAFTAFLGFEVNDGEYKVMGMAPYGEPRYLDKVTQLAEVAEDGSFRLRLRYFDFQHSTTRTFGRRFLDLFGEPRDPAADFITDVSHPGNQAPRELVKRNQYYADLAASIQRFTEDLLLKMARHLHRETGLQALCMAGGVALNSVANGRILTETPFTDLFIPPAPGDSGGALGAALYVWHVVLGKPRVHILEDAYLGEDYEPSKVQAFLEQNGIAYTACRDDAELCERACEDLAAGRVVGWFQGRFEFGPRALGNRSILADPRRAEMKDIVNSKIKFREPFRPFAPVILERNAGEYFRGLPHPERQYPARFMLLVLPWNDGYGEKIPAVNHLGTGRLQTIRPEWNPRYYRLVENFGQATGVPVLMNTSFNLRGEPIVASPADAWRTFSRSGIDILVLENFIVKKPQ